MGEAIVAIGTVCKERIETLTMEGLSVLSGWTMEGTNTFTFTAKVRRGTPIATIEEQVLDKSRGFSSFVLRFGNNGTVECVATGCERVYRQFLQGQYRSWLGRDVDDENIRCSKEATCAVLGLALMILTIVLIWNGYEDALILTKQWHPQATVPEISDLLYTALWKTLTQSNQVFVQDKI